MAAANRERGRCSRVEFLWRAAHSYTAKCPQLAAYWGDRLQSIAGAAPPDAIAERLCPACGSLLLPSPPSPQSPPSPTSLPSPRVQTVSLKRLRYIRRRSQGKKGVWLNKPLGKARAYVLVNCVCGGSYVTAALRRPVHPPAVAMTTPTPTKRRKSGRHSSSLKSMLEESSWRERQRQQQAASPSLSLFLTALNT